MASAIRPIVEQKYEERRTKPIAPTELGPVINRWRYRAWPIALRRIAVLSAAFAAFLFLTIWRVTHGAPTGAIPLALGAGLVLALCLPFLWWAGLSVEIYERSQGLSFACHGNEGAMRWADIISLRVVPGGFDDAAGRGETYLYTALIESSAWRIKLGEPLRDICEAARDNTVATQWARMIAAFEQGAEYQFGAIRVTPKVIRAGDRSWEWTELSRFEIGPATLRLTSQLPRASSAATPALRIDQIQFVHVLERLARERIDEGGAKAGRSVPREIVIETKRTAFGDLPIARVIAH